MFPFSIKIKKKYDLNLKGSTILVEEIEKFVTDNKGLVLSKTDNSLKFKSGFAFGKWDLFAVVDSGIFIIDKNRITFKFSMYKIFIVAAIASFAFVSVSENVYFGIVVFGLFGVLNWIIAIYRCKEALEDIAN